MEALIRLIGGLSKLTSFILNINHENFFDLHNDNILNLLWLFANNDMWQNKERYEISINNYSLKKQLNSK